MNMRVTIIPADWRRDWRWLGCLTERDYYNGCCAKRAIRPPIQKTLIEDNGGGIESTAAQYCDAIRRHLLGKDSLEFIDKDELKYRMGLRTVLHH